VQALRDTVADAVDRRRLVRGQRGASIGDGTLGAGTGGGIYELLPRGIVRGRSARSFG